MVNYIKELQVMTMGIETVELEKVIQSEGRNIFFIEILKVKIILIETNNDITAFHPRLLCAFESAAMHNPTMRV